MKISIALRCCVLAGASNYTLDIVCAAAALIFALLGARKGAIRSVIGLCSTVIALFAAYKLASPTADILNEWFALYGKFSEKICYVLGAVIVFFAAKILLGLIGRILTNIASNVRAIGALNTLLGAVIGLLKAAILICGVLAVFSVLPDTVSFVPKLQAMIDGSFFVKTIQANNPLLSWIEKALENAPAVTI